MAVKKSRNLIFYDEIEGLKTTLFSLKNTKSMALIDAHVVMDDIREDMASKTIIKRDLDKFFMDDCHAVEHVFIFTLDGDKLSMALPLFIQASVTLHAIRLKGHFRQNPLLLFSPPKAGSHFLIALVEAFGYERGGVLPYNPMGGKWYSLDSESIHSSAKNYFYNRNQQGDIFGGRLSAFNDCCGIALYRHPKDILRSRLNYNFDPKNTIMGRYMEGASRAKKLAALLNPYSLFGDIAIELADFTNWMEFPNIIPIAYEECVQLSDDDEVPFDLVWELQLKLQIDGCADEFYKKSFGNSEVFYQGKINLPDQDVDTLSEEIYEKCCYYSDYIGYGLQIERPATLVKRRKKPFSTCNTRIKDKKIPMERTKNFWIYYYNNRFFAQFYKEALDLAEYFGEDELNALQDDEYAPLQRKVYHMEQIALLNKKYSKKE